MFLEEKIDYADNSNNDITCKVFKVYFPQRLEEKTAQEFPSMVEDSDILFHSILGCASLLLK